MKYITIKLTEDQIWACWRTLEWAFHDPDDTLDAEDKRYEAFIRRLRTKLAKAVHEQK